MAQQHGHATTGVDAYGNPVAVHGGMAGHGPVVAGAPDTGTGAQFQPAAAVEQRPRGILHRSSSSSSSSSSEDDGLGGRRKKGIKQKIKEKLPGGNKGNQPQPGTTAAGTFAQPQGPAGTYGQQGHAGTGAVPGTYGQPGHAGMANYTYGQPVQHGHTGTTNAYEHGHAGTAGTYGQPHAGATGGTYGQPGHAGMTGPVGTHAATGEKKGIMDKIKEKLPGHH
ncbi:hypothetical protein QOZ80_9BG0705640 [Eleusine coracana subsp. coracana]|nr:hypothetical protein QOZ80_9BG0705640 [Eleusine coracana subsp. coracana]